MINDSIKMAVFGVGSLNFIIAGIQAASSDITSSPDFVGLIRELGISGVLLGFLVHMINREKKLHDEHRRDKDNTEKKHQEEAAKVQSEHIQEKNKLLDLYTSIVTSTIEEQKQEIKKLTELLKK